jgi:hypothetical protein
VFAIGFAFFAFCFLLFMCPLLSKQKKPEHQRLTKCFKAFSSIFFKKLQWYSSFYLLRRIYLFFLIIVYLDMVNDRRRRPKYKPLNIRHHGYSFQYLKLAERFQLFSEFFWPNFCMIQQSIEEIFY